MLTAEEIQRYARQISLPVFGKEGQEKLKQASVLVVGAGALGCPALTYLATAGVGHIGIVDGDVIELSNLHRQPLYTVEDIGKKKAVQAKERLLKLNPHLRIDTFETFITAQNAFELVEDFDVILDGTDNFATRYLINDCCVLKDKINVHASVLQFTGQLSIFNHLREDGTRGPNYRDIYPQPPKPGEVPSCAEGGVLGALPGILGTLQAVEALKVIAGIGEVLDGKLFLFDVLRFSTQVLSFQKDENNPLTGTHKTQTELIDYQEFCGIIKDINMKSVNVNELKAMIDNQEDFQLIDVREEYEYEAANLEGLLIPLGEVPARHEEISKDKPVIIHCRSGVRSANAIEFLEQNFGYTNLSNLEGGIMAWAREIDMNMQVS
jgi:sulfur-carrier protein adenylyltransferase/sulfurtransferase